MTINSRGERFMGQRGLTLVELLVAVGIIAILAAVAVPNFIADLPRHRLSKATRNLVSDLQWVRHQAVATNRPWGIVFNTGGGSYQVVDSGNNRTFENGAPASDDVIVRTITLADYGSQVQYGAGNAGGDWAGGGLASLAQQANAVFNTRGFITGAAGSTFLANADNSIAFAVTTSLGGGLQVRMYNGILPFNQINWVEK